MTLSSLKKIFDTENYTLHDPWLTNKQLIIFLVIVAISIAGKIILIPYNMVNGEAITRVWNALWWAQNPFFILPNMTHPLYYYLMGLLIYITGEIFYTPLAAMILVMTIGGIYLFKISLLISDFKTALLAYIIFTFTPAIFRLNYNPYPYTITPVLYVIIIYYLLKALFKTNSTKYFVISGIFSFLAIFNRPESIFVLICLCLIALFSKKKGSVSFIVLSLWFQVFWIILSIWLFGSPFATYDRAAEFPNIFDIHGFNLLLRLKGLFLPYFFWLLGVTFVVFYFLIKGIIIVYKRYPLILLITFSIPIIVPAIVNGAAAMRATIFNTTFYIFPMFFFSSIFAAAGIKDFLDRYKNGLIQFVFASLIILSAIPLSYIKDFVPSRYNKLFPRVIQFFQTTANYKEIMKMCGIVDNYIEAYPSLILDGEGGTESTEGYIAYRTKLAPPEKVMITTYNMPKDYEELKQKVEEFMIHNKRGIIITRNSSTKLDAIIRDLNVSKSLFAKIDNVETTKDFTAFIYEIKR